MSSTTYAKRTLYKPIDFFFRGITDLKTKKVVFVDAFQILNDRFLGRMSVCNYFFIAENSVRINELNVIALDELRNYHLVMRQNFFIPEKVVYNLPITTRFLESDREFEVLLATLKDNGYKKGNILISFNTNTLERIDDEAKARYDRLRRLGYQICVSGYGEEYNSLDIFARFTFDYVRLEAQYFDSTPSKKKLLGMLVKFCSANKICLIMEGVDTPAQMNRFRREGVKLVTGKAASKLSRWVTNPFLNLPEPTGEKLNALVSKINKEMLALEKAEVAEYEAAQQAMREKAIADAELGRVTPVAPRPELMKSPYQVRLEQQKETARKAAIARAERAAARKQEVKLTKEEYQGQKLIADAGRTMFEGDVQSFLSTMSAGAEKERRRAQLRESADAKDADSANTSLADQFSMGTILGGFGNKPIIKRAKAEDVATDSAVETAEAKKSTDANAKGETKQEKKPVQKPKKEIVADVDKANRLFNEFKGGSLDSMLSPKAGMGGFGVTLYYDDDDDEEVIEGHYNENGQWVDEDGYVYNGYFDENGEWRDYEAFDSKKEGSYNENGQWVDKDGKVYDGYFDDNGRWIDYTYVDENGNKVDNGYFDKKIKKWVPYGYFDENGTWRKYN